MCSVEGATAESCIMHVTRIIVLVNVNSAPLFFVQNRRAAYRTAVCPACHEPVVETVPLRSKIREKGMIYNLCGEELS